MSLAAILLKKNLPQDPQKDKKISVRLTNLQQKLFTGTLW